MPIEGVTGNAGSPRDLRDTDIIDPTRGRKLEDGREKAVATTTGSGIHAVTVALRHRMPRDKAPQPARDTEKTARQRRRKDREAKGEAGRPKRPASRRHECHLPHDPDPYRGCVQSIKQLSAKPRRPRVELRRARPAQDQRWRLAGGTGEESSTKVAAPMCSTPSARGSHRMPPLPRRAANAPGASSWSIHAHGFAGRPARKATGPDPESRVKTAPRNWSTATPRISTLRRVARGSSASRPSSRADSSRASRSNSVTEAARCAGLPK